VRTPLGRVQEYGKSGDVPQTGALRRPCGLLRDCSQGLLLVPHIASHELLFSSTQYEKIQALLRRSARFFQSNLSPATLSSQRFRLATAFGFCCNIAITLKTPANRRRKLALWPVKQVYSVSHSGASFRRFQSARALSLTHTNRFGLLAQQRWDRPTVFAPGETR
jgi:hypothetical protein